MHATYQITYMHVMEDIQVKANRGISLWKHGHIWMYRGKRSGQFLFLTVFS